MRRTAILNPHSFDKILQEWLLYLEPPNPLSTRSVFVNLLCRLFLMNDCVLTMMLYITLGYMPLEKEGQIYLVHSSWAFSQAWQPAGKFSICWTNECKWMQAWEFQCWRRNGGWHTTELTYHPRQESPLQCIQMVVTHPLFKTKISNTDGPNAEWDSPSQRCALAALSYVELVWSHSIIWITYQHLKDRLHIKNTIRFFCRGRGGEEDSKSANLAPLN